MSEALFRGFKDRFHLGMLSMNPGTLIERRLFNFQIGEEKFVEVTEQNAVRTIRRICGPQIEAEIDCYTPTDVISRGTEEIKDWNGSKRWRRWALGRRRRTHRNMAVASLVAGMWACVRQDISDAIDRMMDD